mmetsp:Transcript_50911/g.111524  ORF Transcript_50911/g.111524 Transcript_50911/m.111524 type:complete len:420 (+) Transcript_50911:68-1327(+)
MGYLPWPVLQTILLLSVLLRVAIFISASLLATCGPGLPNCPTELILLAAGLSMVPPLVEVVLVRPVFSTGRLFTLGLTWLAMFDGLSDALSSGVVRASGSCRGSQMLQAYWPDFGVPFSTEYIAHWAGWAWLACLSQFCAVTSILVQPMPSDEKRKAYFFVSAELLGLETLASCAEDPKLLRDFGSKGYWECLSDIASPAEDPAADGKSLEAGGEDPKKALFCADDTPGYVEYVSEVDIDVGGDAASTVIEGHAARSEVVSSDADTQSEFVSRSAVTQSEFAFRVNLIQLVVKFLLRLVMEDLIQMNMQLSFLQMSVGLVGWDLAAMKVMGSVCVSFLFLLLQCFKAAPLYRTARDRFTGVTPVVPAEYWWVSFTLGVLAVVGVICTVLVCWSATGLVVWTLRGPSADNSTLGASEDIS